VHFDKQVTPGFTDKYSSRNVPYSAMTSGISGLGPTSDISPNTTFQRFWKFVDAGLSDEIAGSRNAWINLMMEAEIQVLLVRIVVIGRETLSRVLEHAAKLHNLERADRSSPVVFARKRVTPLIPVEWQRPQLI